MQQIGIIIRKDGTVPFDIGLDPAIKQGILEHLSTTGHMWQAQEDGSVKLLSGPYVAAKLDK